MTVAGLGLDEALVTAAPVDAFFRWAPQSQSTLCLPLSFAWQSWSDSKV